MRFDSFKSITSLLEALGTQGYQVPFKDYEKDFKNRGFDKQVHCYKFKLSFEHFKSIYGDQVYFILSTEDNDKSYSIIGSMTKHSIEDRLRDLLLVYVKYEIPFDVGTTINELLKLLGENDNKGGSPYGNRK